MDETVTRESVATALAHAGPGQDGGSSLLPLGAWFASLAQGLWQGTDESLTVSVDEAAAGLLPGATAVEMRLEGALSGGVWLGWETEAEVPLGPDELAAWLGAVAQSLGEALGETVSVAAATEQTAPEADAVGFRLILSRTGAENVLVALWSAEALTTVARHLAADAPADAPADASADAPADAEPAEPAGDEEPAPAGVEEETAPEADAAGLFPSLRDDGAGAEAFAPAHAAVPAPPSGNIDLLLDVPLELTVELGRAERRIRDILALAPGAIVELDRLAGEPVDVLVNGKPVARAEVVVIDESFGIRITDILSPAERLDRLR